MIDLHSHILPGLDDGPTTLKMALEMARAAVDDGVTVMVATPHTLNGSYHNPRERILEAHRVFSEALVKENIPLKVLPGCEAHLCSELLKEIESGDVLSFADKGRYLLLELPHPFLLQGVIAFINRLNVMGLTPVIAHGERLPLVQQKPSIMEDIVNAGALCQVTAQSLEGSLGRRAKKCCQELNSLGLIHLLASDAHDLANRRPGLSKACKILGGMMDERDAHHILSTNPSLIIGAGEN
ncbi:tyrosine-protein phosphatase [Desulfatibacillum aliphaticivorans]|uniref:tyrosine-protein phosphatase n=1 Tax=Desulfatibacillum aliphaticivorans TaxID=218208 RepID=UPI0006847C27|nr:CpsB/CapC family capsule biosynthesis tyrosine phosphatase [Desulfatibacillum aliphaticivorans]